MRGLGGTAIVAASLMLAPEAFAQDTPSSATGTGCELHVWPATELKAVTQSWVWNHTVNQAFDPSQGGIDRPKVLAPDQQVGLLGQLNLPELLRLGEASTVVHAEALPRTATSGKARLSDSKSTCYAELIVSQNFYETAPLAPRSLRTLFVMRKFGDAPEVQSSFSTWADTSLQIFPAKTADQAEPADREMSAAFSLNVREFAAYATKPPKKKK